MSCVSCLPEIFGVLWCRQASRADTGVALGREASPDATTSVRTLS